MGERHTAFWPVLGIALVVAVIAALLVVPYPFFGDQALFAVFARMMSGGALLYVDIWDVKQPGIFWFFQLGGGALGLNEIGIHIFEAGYWLLAATMIAVAIRPVFFRRWVAGLLPVLAPGLYFITARTNDLTQVEALVGPLVFGLVWLLWAKGDELPPIHRPALAGVLAGSIACFKLIAVVVPAFVLTTAAVLAFRARHQRRKVLGKLVVPFAVGVSLPLVGLLIWVAANDLFPEVWYTWIEFPRQSIGLADRPLSRLGESVFHYAVALAPVGLMAIHRILRPSERARHLTWLLISSVVGGVVLVVMQLWWAYLFQVLTVPLSVLALQGFDDVLENPRGMRVSVFALLAVLAVPAITDLGTKVGEIGGLVRGQTLHEYRMLSDRYSEAAEIVAETPVEPGAPIYVLGSPLVLYALEADQSVPINGWSPQFWTDAMWREVADELTSGGTEAIYISDSAQSIAEMRAPWFERELSSSFFFHARVGDGRWLVPRLTTSSLDLVREARQEGQLVDMLGDGDPPERRFDCETTGRKTLGVEARRYSGFGYRYAFVSHEPEDGGGRSGCHAPSS